MSKVNQLKNKARREEQRENWSRAIEFYTQALDASRQEDEAFADLSLYNRIGDIYLRIGQKNTAVRYYEQAIERYSEQDLHTSAIALCNKVLRILPERSTVFLQLGRLHLATNLIADARAHYHQYAEAMRARGGTAAAYDALEELIGRTGDRPTLSIWVSWLTNEEDQDVATARVNEAREALSSQGIDSDEVLEKVRTGDASGFHAEQAEVAQEDPLANAFLSVPEHYGPTRAGPAQAGPVSGTTDAVESERVAADAEARDAVQEGMHTIAEDLDLGSMAWQDEFEPTTADLPETDEQDVDGPERTEAHAVGSPDDVDPEEGMSTLSEDLEFPEDEIATVDFLEPATLEALEAPGFDVENLIEESSFELAEEDDAILADFDRDPTVEAIEADSVDSPPMESATSSIEQLEAPDEVDSFNGFESEALSEDELELASPPDDLGAELSSLSTFQLEPPLADTTPPEPEGAEPPEPPLSATMVAAAPSLRDDIEGGEETGEGPDWAPLVDLPETAAAQVRGADALEYRRAELDSVEPSAVETEDWAADAHEEIERVTAAAEQAAAEAAAVEQAALEAAAAEQAAAEAAAAEQAVLEAAAAEQAAAEQAAAEAAAAEQAALEAAAAAQAAVEQAATEAAQAEEASLEVDPAAIESETIAVELPLQAEPTDPAPEPSAAVSEVEAEDISQPLAEPRLKTEDPEEAFGEWVSSASQGVLRRALPELEERDEHAKALLVIHRLSNLEDHDVEFRQRYVDALQDLGRIEEATEACLVLACGLEALGRPTEARQAYARVMDLTPGDPQGQQGFDRLEGAVDAQDAQPEVVEDGAATTPYTPSHVGSGSDAGMIVTHPRAGNPPPRNGGAGARDHEQSRPYSGVAGGVDAASDFEQLLSEFRAELSEKPKTSNSVSRTEYGATLKGMGKLDDAIRELQAAVRDPSPPPLAYELLGEAFLEKGQSRIAVRLLEKALASLGQTDREMLGVLYQLGVCYERLEDLAKAVLCYERIFSVDIDYRDVQDRILTCSV